MKYLAAATVALLVWCAGPWASAADGDVVGGNGPATGRNRIVAIVNSEVITAADVAQAMAPLYGQYQSMYPEDELPSKMQEMEPRIVNLLIEEKLMLQEAKTPRTFEVAKGKWATPVPVKVSDEELTDALAQVKGQLGSEEEFQKILRDHEMTSQDLENRYRDQITIQKLMDREVRERVNISPSEITAYYEQHLEDYKSLPAVRLSNILIRVSGVLDDAQAKAKAHDVWQALNAGAEFGELAKRYSEGPNAQGGGMIGWVERGRLIPEIEASVFTMEPGQISPVVKSSLGYHVFRMEEQRPARTKPIAEVQGEIRDKLYQQKYRARYAEWMSKLKERAYITIK